MINREIYEKLKNEFGKDSSWAIWEDQDNIDDLSIFDSTGLLEVLQTDYILVAIRRPSDGQDAISSTWANFHSADKRHSDHRIYEFVKDTRFWGAYMTDIHKSSTGDGVSFDKLDKELEIIGGSPKLIAFGSEAFQELSSYYEGKYSIVQIRSYADVYHGISLEDYRKECLEKLQNY